MKKPITVTTTVHAPISTVWEYWNNPSHIVHWAFASDDWEAPRAFNDLRVGGTFTIVMAAKDGSASFDFGGTYTTIEPERHLAFTMSDGRRVTVDFEDRGSEVIVTEIFDPEYENPDEVQRSGWQAILNHFKAYVEKTRSVSLFTYPKEGK